MHNNYYFLRQLSQRLASLLTGWELAASFSQNKDELMLGFFNPDDPAQEYYIKAHLYPQFCCLHFPDDFKRSKKNSINLFSILIGKKVVSIRQFVNERSFALIVEGEEGSSPFTLLFKMHGNRSNVLLCAGNQLHALFKSNLKKDEALDVNALDRSIDTSYEYFVERNGNVQAIYPTFGPIVKYYLQQQGYDALPIDKKWEVLQTTLRQLETPGRYYIIELQGTLHLSLLKTGHVMVTHHDPIQAINDFFLRYMRNFYLEREKSDIVKTLEKKKQQADNYIRKSSQKLTALQEGMKQEEIAHIIMANLHHIPAHVSQIELFNFYTNQPITIKLKKELSPQKNAEVYYRKAKNQKLEIAQLEKNVQDKQAQLSDIENHLAKLHAMEDIRELRQYLKEQQLQEVKQPKGQELPYRQLEIEGFTVLIGKNAKSNDALIRHYAWKEDLWLHAKDVRGAHVIIKHQAGKNFPKTLIEKAASLAAYYSKRKTDSLCPVSFTLRKYVRKSKNLAPGQVIVDREETILVEPGLV